jgi:geranylgeranyl pyrophosphate synthase
MDMINLNTPKIEVSAHIKKIDIHRSNEVLQKVNLIKSQINDKLSQFSDKAPYHSSLMEFVEEAHRILLSPDAKRIRAIIPVLIGRKLALDPESCLLNGVALELLHFTSLIHDDVIDNDQIRRGYPTLNHSFAKNHAVLIGDYMMCEVINYGLSSKYSTKVIGLLVEAVKRLVSGIIMEQNVLPTNPTLENYTQMVEHKTGSLFSLSFALPLVADNRFSTAMSCGRQFGLLFQIYDDFLDRGNDK